MTTGTGNPLEQDHEFTLSFANPNPTSSKTGDGPRYRVSMEVDQETFLHFMDAETLGMVIEATCLVTHRYAGDRQGSQRSAKDVAQQAVEQMRHGIEQAETPVPEGKGPYGKVAQMLHRCGWFMNPRVVHAAGSDEEFRRWVTYQPCVVTGEYNEVDTAGDQRSIACHVRRAGESGTGYKPKYRCVPMVDAVHTKLQHQHGESAAFKLYVERSGEDRKVTAGAAKDWFDLQVSKLLSTWARDAIKTKLGYESWTNVPPDEFLLWCGEHDLVDSLPKTVLSAMQEFATDDD